MALTIGQVANAADLQRMKRTLERLATVSAARRPTDDCPILEVLEDHDDISH